MDNKMQENQEIYNATLNVEELNLPTQTGGAPALAPKKLGMFSLTRYMIRKAKVRLAKAQLRQTRRNAK